MKPDWGEVCEMVTQDISHETVLKMHYGPEIATARNIRADGVRRSEPDRIIESEIIRSLMRRNGLDYGIASALAKMTRT